MDFQPKTQNSTLKQNKLASKKLEDENKQMEHRLEELKRAMNREKEERQNSAKNYYWSKGKTGAVLNYNKTLKSDQNTPNGKPRRVTILKDQPISLPNRPAIPGTMAYIAKGEVENKWSAGITNKKSKEPKCGQCEEKSAAVQCQECSENYCAKCFASFHLKGALRQHRSLPLSANTPRQAMIETSTKLTSVISNESNLAKVNLEKDEQSKMLSTQDEAKEFLKQMMMRQIGVGKSNNTNVNVKNSVKFSQFQNQTDLDSCENNSFLNGEYDSEANAKDFQNALNQWRQHPSGTKGASAAGGPLYSAKTQDTETQMVPNNENRVSQLEIHFKHSLSYAERLLLRKHRRSQLANINVQPLSPSPTEDELRQRCRASNSQKRNSARTPRHIASLRMSREMSSVNNMDNVDFEYLRNIISSPDLSNSTHQDNDSLKNYTLRTNIVIKQEEYAPNLILNRKVPNTDSSEINSSPNISNCDPEVGERFERENETTSRNSRPSSSTRKIKRGIGYDQPVSARGVKSRAESRLMSSRDGRNGLTTTPSLELSAIAALSSYVMQEAPRNTDLTDFMLLGVADEHEKGGTSVRPKSAQFVSSSSNIDSRPSSRPSTSLSNRFYQLGPRSWRQDSSVINESNEKQLPERLVAWSSLPAQSEDVELLSEGYLINALPFSRPTSAISRSTKVTQMLRSDSNDSDSLSDDISAGSSTPRVKQPQQHRSGLLHASDDSSDADDIADDESALKRLGEEITFEKEMNRQSEFNEEYSLDLSSRELQSAMEADNEMDNLESERFHDSDEVLHLV